MLDFLGTIAVTTVMVVVINAVVSTLPVSRLQRLSAALVVGLWIGLAAASANAGLLAAPGPFPLIAVFVAFPLVAVTALAALSPSWRAALLGLPTPLLVGLNASRVIGAFFLLLAATGRMNGPFPISAGWGDIITGLLAPLALWLVVRPKRAGQPLVGAWNAFGALDLVVAIALGFTSAQNSPIPLFDVSPGSSAVLMLPWSFIPTVLVPTYLIMHAILFAQLRQAAHRDGRNRLVARTA
jgi:hypothetical protein